MRYLPLLLLLGTVACGDANPIAPQPATVTQIVPGKQPHADTYVMPETCGVWWFNPPCP